MSDNIVLPVTYPTITSWTWVANLFSIIESNDKAKPWIYSNYIQTYCEEDLRGDNGFLYMDYFPCDLHCFFDCPWLNSQLMTRKTIEGIQSNLFDFFINSLKAGNYIYGLFDEGLLFHKDKFLHELFIYGYNSEKKRFLVADFTFGNSKYSYAEFPAEDVCNAYLSVKEGEDYLWDFKGGLLLIQPRKNADYVFDIHLVQQSINEYLSSFNSFYNYRSRLIPYTRAKFGTGVYQIILNKLETIDAKNINYDIKALHNLYDHKVLMVKRVEYMVQNGHVDLPASIIDNFAAIRNKSNMLWNVCLKQNIKNMKSDIVKKDIMELISRIRDEEAILLERVCNNIIHK